MKFGNLFSITTSAALLLQIGTFVDANPMFAQPLAQHNDDASTQDACSDMRITFPANQPGQDPIVFENNTKHVISWHMTEDAFDQVNITLVNKNDNNNVVRIGEFDANRGATNETNFAVDQPGTYQVNIDTIGGSSPCQIKSSDFEIKASSPSHDDHINQEDTDRAIKAIKSSATQSHANDQKDQDWEEALDEIDGYIKKNHSNDADDGAKDDGDKDDDLPDFESFIEGLNMDHTKYLDNNKATVDEVITHKNSADEIESAVNDTPHQNADQYFTNKDNRTHANKHLNEELDKLLGDKKSAAASHSHDNSDHSTNDNAPVIDKHLNDELDKLAEHNDAPMFSEGSAGSVKTQSMATSSTTAINSDEWSVEELPAPAHEWVDESDNVPNHSDEGDWTSEDIDPSAMANMHDDRADWGNTPPTYSEPFDHSDLGHWNEEEVDVLPEPDTKAYTHSDAVTGTWVEGDGAESFSVPDHSNVGEWKAEEINADSESWQQVSDIHDDLVEDGWQVTTSDHADLAGSGWTEHVDEEPSDHGNLAGSGWTEHVDEVPSKHANLAGSGWTEHVDEELNEHANVAKSGWVDEPGHSNMAQSGWTE